MSAERPPQVEPSTMKPRPHGIRTQLTRERNLFVAEAAAFAHQKYVAVYRIQAAERLAEGRRQRLCWRSGGLIAQRGRGSLSTTIAQVIERKVSGNAKQPGPPAAISTLRHRGARHAKKHFLRELLRIFLTDNPAQITEHSVAVRGKEDVCVAHEVLGCH